MLVLVAARAVADATDPFAGCAAALTNGMMTLTCPNDVVLYDFSALGTDGDVLNGGMSVFGAQSAVVDELQSAQLGVVKVFIAPTRPGPMVATATTRRPGVGEFVGCVPAGDACEALVVDVLEHGLPDLHALLPGWADSPRFSGATFDVPRGCYPVSTDLPGFMCGLDVVGAAETERTDPPDVMLREALAARNKAAKKAGTSRTVTELPCTIDGSPGSCAVTARAAHTPFETTFDVVGYAERNGRMLTAACRWAGTSPEPPAMCGQVVTWQAAAP